MTDPTAVAPPAPVRAIDLARTFIGDLARPFAVYVVSAAEAWAILAGKDAGIITAGGVVLGALYAAKTIEVQQADKHARDIAVAQAGAAK